MVPNWLIAVLLIAGAMWVFTAGVAFVFTAQALHRDSLPRATVAAICAAIHVTIAMLVGHAPVTYLLAALLVLALAVLAGSRSLLRLDPVL